MIHLKNYLKTLRYKYKYRGIYNKQKEVMDCGPSALSIVLRYYKKKISISRIAQIAETDYYGTSGKGMIVAAEYFGFTTRGIKIDNKNFFQINNEFLPLICCIKMNSIKHYIVVLEIKNTEVIYIDPLKGIIINTKENFIKKFNNFVLLLKPNENFNEILNDDNNNYILHIIFHQKIKILLIIAFSILISIFGIANSVYYRYLLDDIIPNKNVQSLIYYTILTILIYMIKGIIDICRQFLVLKLSEELDNSIMGIVYKKLFNLPYQFYNSRNTGDIISRIDDVNIIRDGIAQTILTLFMDINLAIVGFCLLYNLNKKLLYLTFIPLFLYILSMRLLKNILQSFNLKILSLKGKLKNLLLESLNGFEKIKSFQKEKYFYNELYDEFKSFTKTGRKYGNLVSIQLTLQQQINVIFSIIVLLIGSMDILNFKMSIGELIMFNSLLLYFINPITNIISLFPNLISFKVANNRINDLLNLKEESLGGSDKHINNYNINFENVSFGYNYRNTILKNINFEIEEGTKVGIVGKSGSGKTTILNLLQNYYTPYNGKINIGNKNINTYSKKTLRRDISCVSQNNYLFSRSILDNFRLANKNLKYEEIKSICQEVGIHTLITQLPNGYNTIINESGTNLSGGEKQKLAIAIALSKKPKILLFDEATSNLDASSELEITNLIEDLKNITILIVSHRLSLVKKCDKIIVLENGQIVECDTHNNLLMNKKSYYHLWNIQMGKKRGEKIEKL